MVKIQIVYTLYLRTDPNNVIDQPVVYCHKTDPVQAGHCNINVIRRAQIAELRRHFIQRAATAPAKLLAFSKPVRHCFHRQLGEISSRFPIRDGFLLGLRFRRSGCFGFVKRVQLQLIRMHLFVGSAEALLLFKTELFLVPFEFGQQFGILLFQLGNLLLELFQGEGIRFSPIKKRFDGREEKSCCPGLDRLYRRDLGMRLVLSERQTIEHPAAHAASDIVEPCRQRAIETSRVQTCGSRARSRHDPNAEF